ncbi:MAG: Na+:solute symporter [Pirellulales bacterium]|nr:Na+:solute symporter [Pirellulales bacterium]
MQLHPIDVVIVVAYLVAVVAAGLVVSRWAKHNIDAYFLGGKTIPWYYLGVANASGMFDITGTSWMVVILFLYGLKSAWIPWLWPTFNQVFLMVYLSVWLRRSGVMTGAEWIRTRFGDRAGGELSHLSVVLFALVSVIAFQAYAFKPIGTFSVTFFQWGLTANQYALLFTGVTTLYVIAGGMYSVVVTDLLQFAIMAVACVLVAAVAMTHVGPEAIAAATPEGWGDLFFGWTLDLDWSGHFEPAADEVHAQGYSLFGAFFMLILLKGILNSMAGPNPNYDMQKILSTRSPREAALMSFCSSAVLFVPRYLLIAGVTVLALACYTSAPDMIPPKDGGGRDFEFILPYVLGHRLAPGVVGLTLAGLLAAFMSTFSCTVNAGASYAVNDVYKRYIRPDASPRHYVWASYIASIAVVVIGIFFGLYVESIDAILKWITVGLGSGYIASNVLKWYWWRFNGYGYFAGMISGIAAATFFEKALELAAPDWCAWFAQRADHFPLVIAIFPLVLVLSTVAAVVTSLCTEPDDEEVLKSFYRRVRPWGFWGPIHAKVAAEDPAFRKNTDLPRDAVNVVVGTIWQMGLIVAPIYLVIRDWPALAASVVVIAATSVFLKVNWYNKLEEE